MSCEQCIVESNKKAFFIWICFFFFSSLVFHLARTKSVMKKKSSSKINHGWMSSKSHCVPSKPSHNSFHSIIGSSVYCLLFYSESHEQLNNHIAIDFELVFFRFFFALDLTSTLFRCQENYITPTNETRKINFFIRLRTHSKSGKKWWISILQKSRTTLN